MDDLFDDSHDLSDEEAERETQALTTLARQAIDDRRDKEEKERVAKSAAKKAAASEARLWAAMEESKQKTTTLELGEGYGEVQVGRRETITSRVLDQEEAEAALTAAGLADEVLEPTRNVRKKVLNQHVRDLLKAGKPLPEGVDFHPRRYVQFSFK